MKLDILAFAAHPDDAELACSGTLLRHIALGYKVGVVDLTRGQLGSRGTPALRDKEAADASVILGLHVRENLSMEDGFFSDDNEHKLAVVKAIRKYRPGIVLANAIEDRHPDHGRASKLVSEACFMAGLVKVMTTLNGQTQGAWRPIAVYHYIQDRYIKPDLVINITPYMATKMAAIRAFSSQFYHPDSTEPETPISTPEFLDFIKARSMQFGRDIGVTYAEGYTVERTPGVNNLLELL